MWEAIKSLPTWAQIVFVIFVIALAGSIGLVRHQARLSIRQQKELDRQQKTLDDKQRELDRLKMKHQEQHIYFLDQWRIKPAQLDFEKKLAAGAEGEVWRGRLLGHDRKGLVAIKKALPNPMSAGEAAPVWTEREVSFLMSMNHPQIVEFIGAGEIMDEKFGEHVPFIVQELMSGGSIDGCLWNPESSPRNSITWETRFTWLRDVAEGMTHIHSRGYAHRDLKSANVLYDRSSMHAKGLLFQFHPRVSGFISFIMHMCVIKCLTPVMILCSRRFWHVSTSGGGGGRRI